MSDDHAECQAALNTARRLTAEAIDAGARQAETCPVTDPPSSDPCGKPAKRYQMPLGASHVACPTHRVMFLALIAQLSE